MYPISVFCNEIPANYTWPQDDHVVDYQRDESIVSLLLSYPDLCDLPKWVQEKDINELKSLILREEKYTRSYSYPNEKFTHKLSDFNKKLKSYIINNSFTLGQINLPYDKIINIRSSMPYTREEWPPAQLCQLCEQFWIDIEQLPQKKSFLFSNHDIQHPHSIGSICHDSNAINQALKDVCVKLYRISIYNLTEIDKDFKYFSWTKTRQFIEALRNIYNDKNVKSLCDLYAN